MPLLALQHTASRKVMMVETRNAGYNKYPTSLTDQENDKRETELRSAPVPLISIIAVSRMHVRVSRIADSALGSLVGM
jgi:hypothetical protein